MIQIVRLTQLSSSSTTTAPCMASDKGNFCTPLTAAALLLQGLHFKNTQPFQKDWAHLWPDWPHIYSPERWWNQQTKTDTKSYIYTQHKNTPFCFLWQCCVYSLILSKLASDSECEQQQTIRCVVYWACCCRVNVSSLFPWLFRLLDQGRLIVKVTLYRKQLSLMRACVEGLTSCPEKLISSASFYLLLVLFLLQLHQSHEIL